MGFFIASTSAGYALSLLLSGIALPLGGYNSPFFSPAWDAAWRSCRLDRPAGTKKTSSPSAAPPPKDRSGGYWETSRPCS